MASFCHYKGTQKKDHQSPGKHRCVEHTTMAKKLPSSSLHQAFVSPVQLKLPSLPNFLTKSLDPSSSTPVYSAASVFHIRYFGYVAANTPASFLSLEGKKKGTETRLTTLKSDAAA